MKTNTLFVTLAAVAAGALLAGCSRGPATDTEAPNYRELAVVLEARLAPCLNQPGFEPPWPKTDWRFDRNPVDYAHAGPIAAPRQGSEPAPVHYLMHIGDKGFAVYVSQVAGAPPTPGTAAQATPTVRQVFGPLPFSAKCPEVAASAASSAASAPAASAAASAPR